MLGGKAILEFEMPKDYSDFVMASNGYKFALFIMELRREIRAKAKYGEEEHQEKWREFQDFVNGMMISEGVHEIIESIP